MRKGSRVFGVLLDNPDSLGIGKLFGKDDLVDCTYAKEILEYRTWMLKGNRLADVTDRVQIENLPRLSSVSKKRVPGGRLDLFLDFVAVGNQSWSTVSPLNALMQRVSIPVIPINTLSFITRVERQNPLSGWTPTNLRLKGARNSALPDFLE